MIQPELSRRIAEALLDIQAIELRTGEPFIWTSGIRSPIYCDNRLSMSYPETRRLIAEGFAAVIRAQFSGVEVIAGTATAGIPHAAWVADKLQLPMIYVRDKAKGHGKQNQIEGVLRPGQKVVVIEDLISTGGSALKAAEAIRLAGGDVLGVCAIFTYEFDQAAEAFQAAGLPLCALSNYSTLLEVAAARNIIRQDQLSLLQSWRANPESY